MVAPMALPRSVGGGDPRRDPGLRFAAYPARQLALRWPSAPALAEELRAIGEQAGQRGAVFRWDGSLIAFEGPATRPLDPDELQQLAKYIGSLDSEMQVVAQPHFRMGQK